ncbi:hypothetical protein JVT61DRAFT_345 [Boletus reticuloceps]|uniref:Uncharacterized protein n=1 Tax=Boletus reticuloceps TaxID=495285 RepID=A0A8I3AGN3_9AGAM|nr:hypothetical protein JVT61DRAFT_345 [Boletus reticuloceps]
MHENVSRLYCIRCCKVVTDSQSERGLFILREQLKIQFKETQKAQINERKEADSKQ